MYGFQWCLGCSCIRVVITSLDAVVTMLSLQLLLINLFWTLFMAQGGYLHLTRASLRCDNSFENSSGLVQTVFALWVNIPMTLYLADKLWWLSHCKYWSVWVGLWYTVNDRELSASGVTKVWCKTLSWLESYLFGHVYKVTCTLYMMGDLPTNGLSTLLRTLATP